MVMVGDEEKNDIKVPNKLGMTTVRINPYNKKTLANYQIDNINELPNAIK
jgi:FMN phosphatase YigB (HAD superfamily)